jgi:DNA polymerase sigma
VLIVKAYLKVSNLNDVASGGLVGSGWPRKILVWIEDREREKGEKVYHKEEEMGED